LPENQAPEKWEILLTGRRRNDWNRADGFACVPVSGEAEATCLPVAGGNPLRGRDFSRKPGFTISGIVMRPLPGRQRDSEKVHGDSLAG